MRSRRLSGLNLNLINLNRFKDDKIATLIKPGGIPNQLILFCQRISKPGGIPSSPYFFCQTILNLGASLFDGPPHRRGADGWDPRRALRADEGGFEDSRKQTTRKRPPETGAGDTT